MLAILISTTASFETIFSMASKQLLRITSFNGQAGVVSITVKLMLPSLILQVTDHIQTYQILLKIRVLNGF